MGGDALPVVLLVGCGKMGSALLTGWLNSDQIGNIYVVEPSGINVVGQSEKLIVFNDPSTIPVTFIPDIIVFAVKPQVMPVVAPAYYGFVQRGAVVLSIAAGQTIASITRHLGDNAAIIRSMPNTPAAVGRGITVAVANRLVSIPAKKLATTLLEAVGSVEWIDDEGLLDAVTAVSGSGPAYVFLLIETLAHAGVKAGLPIDLAMRLARATVFGSGELARLSNDSAEQLRKNVTSPNGTTAAALNVLMAENGLQVLFDAAIAAATSRSRELAS